MTSENKQNNRIIWIAFGLFVLGFVIGGSLGLWVSGPPQIVTIDEHAFFEDYILQAVDWLPKDLDGVSLIQTETHTLFFWEHQEKGRKYLLFHVIETPELSK